MLYFVCAGILTIFTLILTKYLQYKLGWKFLALCFLIILLNTLLYGFWQGIMILEDRKIAHEFHNSSIQLYPHGHPEHGSIRSYESLNEEEKELHDAFFGDTGRNFFMYLLNPIFAGINLIITFIFFFVFDLSVFAAARVRRKLDKTWQKKIP